MVIAVLLRNRGTAPLLVNVTVWVTLKKSTDSVPKSRLLALRLMVGAGPAPSTALGWPP
jgi:hypothetical protein